MRALLADLASLLARDGFAPEYGDATGRGSGGPFEQAAFVRDDRRLLLWLRHTSLSVRYQVGDRVLGHQDYMRELLGSGGGNRFPAYADDAALAVAALADDLTVHGDDFLRGDGSVFARAVAKCDHNAALSGFERMRADATGDQVEPRASSELSGLERKRLEIKQRHLDAEDDAMRSSRLRRIREFARRQTTLERKARAAIRRAGAAPPADLAGPAEPWQRELAEAVDSLLRLHWRDPSTTPDGVGLMLLTATDRGLQVDATLHLLPEGFRPLRVEFDRAGAWAVRVASESEATATAQRRDPRRPMPWILTLRASRRAS